MGYKARSSRDVPRQPAVPVRSRTPRRVPVAAPGPRRSACPLAATPTTDMAPPRAIFRCSAFTPRRTTNRRPIAPERSPTVRKKHFSISTKGVKEGDFIDDLRFRATRRSTSCRTWVAYIAESSTRPKSLVRARAARHHFQSAGVSTPRCASTTLPLTPDAATPGKMAA